MKLLVLLLFIAIVGSLGSGLYFLVKGKGDNKGMMAKALTVRISLSVALFALLFAAWAAGLIQPHAPGF